MNKTTVINIKTDLKLKNDAQVLAERLGISLSDLVKASVRRTLAERTLIFADYERPTEYMLKALKRVERERKIGQVSPTFDNATDAITWLHNPKGRYAGKI